MTASFGAYGKIPALGDFFRLNVPGEFVTQWDGWLQRSLHAARSRLGDGWTELYMRAPIWRFTLAPGVVAQTAMQGVMMPSVDRVGRQFPLTLATGLPGAGQVGGTHLASHACLEALEDVALSALDAANGLPELEARLAEVPAPVIPPAIQSQTFGNVTSFQASQADLAAPGLGGLSFGKGALGIWSATLEDGHRYLVFDGMPDEVWAEKLFTLDIPDVKTEHR